MLEHGQLRDGREGRSDRRGRSPIGSGRRTTEPRRKRTGRRRRGIGARTGSLGSVSCRCAMARDEPERDVQRDRPHEGNQHQDGRDDQRPTARIPHVFREGAVGPHRLSHWLFACRPERAASSRTFDIARSYLTRCANRQAQEGRTRPRRGSKSPRRSAGGSVSGTARRAGGAIPPGLEGQAVCDLMSQTSLRPDAAATERVEARVAVVEPADADDAPSHETRGFHGLNRPDGLKSHSHTWSM